MPNSSQQVMRMLMYVSALMFLHELCLHNHTLFKIPQVKPDIVTHTCEPGTWEVKAGEASTRGRQYIVSPL